MKARPIKPVLQASDVAAICRVGTATVGRWARAGRIASFRTPGGHRRYHREDVIAMLEHGYQPAEPDQLPPTARPPSSTARPPSSSAGLRFS